MKVIVDAGRVKYEPNFGYTTGILVGPNWYEERLHYIKENHEHDSTYFLDYTKNAQKNFKKDINTYWNIKLAGEGIDKQTIMDHEGTKYHENYSTLYDLTYNHLAHVKRPLRTYFPCKGVYLPEHDMGLNYGNITEFGLKKQKEKLWRYQNATETRHWTTENSECYYPPKKEDYNYERYATPTYLSSSLFSINREFADVKLRNQPIFRVPDFPLKVQERPYPHFYY